MIYFNRDLSWIEFNARVLYEGLREDNPLIERLKFLSIVSTNFEEFFQVRVASLKHLEKTNPNAKDITGDTISEIIHKISERTHEIVAEQDNALQTKIIPGLAQNNIVYVSPENFSEQQKAYTQSYFTHEIFPLLTPLRVDDGSFPRISNQSVNVYFKLKKIRGIHKGTSLIQIEDNEKYSAVVQLPASLSRLLWLPSEENKKSFTILDDLLTVYGTQLFSGFEVEDSILFSVSRDADMGVNEESGNQFIEAMEEILADRKTSVAVRLMCSCKNRKTSEVLIKELETKLSLTDDDVYVVKSALHPEALEELAQIEEAKSLRFTPWKNFLPKILTSDISIWSFIKNKDTILHVPYESFEPVQKLLKVASEDQNVLAIKITLYRTENHSEIIKSLIRAAHNGKQVTAFVELKARFDEQRNIEWATKLEKAGVIVIYGIVNLKVHGKTMMIVRKEKEGIRRYVHLSTGNYNSKTARVYSDLSLFTANPQIADDITLFFNTISGYSALQTMKHIYMAPINLKTQLLKMIQRETESSTPENPGLIMAKMNALGHEEIINALYKANQAGVKILLNVRGICQLIPGVEGLSENIKVVSIVDHYLEHSRIFYFKNCGNDELYLSSADWMPRNLDRRVELMFPVTDTEGFSKVKKTLETYFKDNQHAHELLSSGKWQPIKANANKKVSAQKELYEDFRLLDEFTKKDVKIEFEVRRNN